MSIWNLLHPRKVKAAKEICKLGQLLTAKDTGNRIWKVITVEKRGCLMGVDPQSCSEALSVLVAIMTDGFPFVTWREISKYFRPYSVGDSVEEAMREGVNS